MNAFIFAFAAALIASSSGAPEGRILGGENTEDGEFPYQVSVRMMGSHFCGASIIGREWVLTAAHCAGETDGLYSFQAGTINRVGGGTLHRIAKKIVHPAYGANENGAPINDIALFKVTPPFKFNNEIDAIPLPSQGQDTPVGSTGVITGWGSLWEGGRALPFFLQKVSVPIISKKDCFAFYAVNGGIPENEICTLFPEGGKDACQGDSGGPLVVDGLLRGVVSWGFGCGRRDFPGVYTEVARYREWIQQNSGI